MTTVDDCRPLPGLPGYFVTATGEVYSNRRGWRRLKPAYHKDGYQRVYLKVDRRTVVRFVHCLVLQAYVGERPSPKHVCRHLNGNHLDNRVENLKWGTQAENAEDARRHGTVSWFFTYGERASRVKLTEEQVREIEQRVRAGESGPALATEYGVTFKTIYHIRDHKTWRHLWADTRDEFMAARSVA